MPVKEVSEHSGFPEILDGRVKTLVPQIHGGILGRRDLAGACGADGGARHRADRSGGGQPLSVRGDSGARAPPMTDCVENIDIGGPALIRAAAKNHDFVTVLTEPDQYRPGAGRARAARRHHARAAAAACRRGVCADGRVRRGDRLVVRRAARRGNFRALGDCRHAAPDAALWREPASGGGLLRHRRAALASRPRCRCRARSCRTTT